MTDATTDVAAAGQGLGPSRLALANGVVVLAKAAPTMPSVTISVVVRAGSAYDPADAPGLAYFVSRVLDRGTERRHGDAIAEVLDGRGVTLSVSVNRQILSLICTCLAEDFDALFELVADIVRRPVFPEEEIEKRRGEIVTGIRQDEDSPFTRAVDELLALLYDGGHPFGHSPKGSVEGVERIGRPALRRFHRRRYVPQALTVAIVGDVSPVRAFDAAAAAFEDWAATAKGDDTLPPAPRAASRRQVVVPMIGKVQADIAYGFAALARDDPQYYAAWVMNNVLGQYGLGGRIGDSVRERQGMAYYAFSSFEASVIAGPLIVRAGVSPANVDRALASIDVEVARMAAEGITDQELLESKQYLTGSLPRTLETNAGIASFLQVAEQYGLGLDYDLRLPGLVRGVTRADVRAVAGRLLDPARATVVIAGPPDAG